MPETIDATVSLGPLGQAVLAQADRQVQPHGGGPPVLVGAAAKMRAVAALVEAALVRIDPAYLGRVRLWIHPLIASSAPKHTKHIRTYLRADDDGLTRLAMVDLAVENPVAQAARQDPGETTHRVRVLVLHGVRSPEGRDGAGVFSTFQDDLIRNAADEAHEMAWGVGDPAKGLPPGLVTVFQRTHELLVPPGLRLLDDDASTQAAIEAGCEPVVLGRPEVEGFGLHQPDGKSPLDDRYELDFTVPVT